MNSRIVVYFINFNDSYYIPFFHKHYSQFCEKIVMFDNYSTDNSVDIARRLGIEVRYFGVRGELNDQHYLNIKNWCWKERREKSNYVIVCDADEFLVIPPGTILKGSCPVVTGYNMFSEHLPNGDIASIKTGYEDVNYSKQVIFDPNKITEINFVHGCHKNNKEGTIEEGTPLKMLHYRCIGGFQRLYDRHQEYQKRMSNFNKTYGMGHHYLVTEEQKKIEWGVMKSKAYDLW